MSIDITRYFWENLISGKNVIVAKFYLTPASSSDEDRGISTKCTRLQRKSRLYLEKLLTASNDYLMVCTN